MMPVTLEAEPLYELVPSDLSHCRESSTIHSDTINQNYDSSPWPTIAIVAAISSLTPLGSTILPPLLPRIMNDLKSSNEAAESFIVSSYTLGYCFGPLLLAPTSDVYGRSIIYRFCLLGFFVGTVCCALASNVSSLCAFRLIAGSFGSAPQAIAGATISEIVSQNMRGRATAVVTCGTLFPSAIGPLFGTFISAYFGWRHIFSFLAVATCVVSLSTVYLQETHAPTIQRQLLKGRTQQEWTLQNDTTWEDKFHRPVATKQIFDAWSSVVQMARPLCLISVFTGVTNAYMMILLITINTVLEDEYGFSIKEIGWWYLALGIGGGIGMILVGWLSDRALACPGESQPLNKPEKRLQSAVVCGLLMATGLFLYGWAAELQYHWAIPLLGAAIFNSANLGSQVAVRSYIIDKYMASSTPALAANLIYRSLFTVLLPLGGRGLYRVLGLGWGSSLLGFSTLVMLPIPIAILNKN